MAKLTDVIVPDLGDFHDVAVIEIAVKPGDEVHKDQALLTLETDKATMDLPSPSGGKVKELLVAVGQKVNKGSRIAILEGGQAEGGLAEGEQTEGEQNEGERADKQRRGGEPGAVPVMKVATSGERASSAAASGTQALPPSSIASGSSARAPGPVLVVPPPHETDEPEVGVAGSALLAMRKPASHATPAPDVLSKVAPPPPLVVVKPAAHASPAVRHLGRELGIDLALVKGTGPRERILERDVKEYVKANLGKTRAQPGGLALPEVPFVDFARFGSVELQPLSRIKKLTAANLHRSWLHVVHVTQHDEADITDLEGFRKSESESAKQRNLRLTLLPFVMKAVVATLKAFPTFNASLDAQGENLILKRYYHLGIAVDTEEGLLVPVIRDVDHKGVYDLAAELAKVSERARARKLMPGDMQGASFTISSLGGIGGTAFTPVVNVPEVAILGVSRASMQPVWAGGAFVPRLMLPLSLSYDHRVNDGALAARFTSYLRQMLSDIKRLLL